MPSREVLVAGRRVPARALHDEVVDEDAVTGVELAVLVQVDSDVDLRVAGELLRDALVEVRLGEPVERRTGLDPRPVGLFDASMATKSPNQLSVCT